MKMEVEVTKVEVYKNLKLPKRYTGSIAVYWHQCKKDDGYWQYKSIGDWDNLGSSSGGGLERRFPSESTDMGSVEFMYDQLNEMVKYFTKLNADGIGRYDLHASINDYEDEADEADEDEVGEIAKDIKKDIESGKYEVRITIDNNRSLDSNIYNRPYNPECKLANWNFKN